MVGRGGRVERGVCAEVVYGYGCRRGKKGGKSSRVPLQHKTVCCLQVAEKEMCEEHSTVHARKASEKRSQQSRTLTCPSKPTRTPLRVIGGGSSGTPLPSSHVVPRHPKRPFGAGEALCAAPRHLRCVAGWRRSYEDIDMG